MAEWLGNRAINQKVAGSIPGHENDVVSLGKTLHPIRGNVPVLTVSWSGWECLLNDLMYCRQNWMQLSLSTQSSLNPIDFLDLGWSFSTFLSLSVSLENMAPQLQIHGCMTLLLQAHMVQINRTLQGLIHKCLGSFPLKGNRDGEHTLGDSTWGHNLKVECKPWLCEHLQTHTHTHTHTGLLCVDLHIHHRHQHKQFPDWDNNPFNNNWQPNLQIIGALYQLNHFQLNNLSRIRAQHQQMSTFLLFYKNEIGRASWRERV